MGRKSRLKRERRNARDAKNARIRKHLIEKWPQGASSPGFGFDHFAEWGEGNCDLCGWDYDKTGDYRMNGKSDGEYICGQCLDLHPDIDWDVLDDEEMEESGKTWDDIH